MEIMKKIISKAANNRDAGHVTIAFLGDSVTQGCFEVYKKADKSLETIFDKEHSYHTLLNKMFSVLYPSVPINMINAGVSGGTATHGSRRLERDVIRYNPDLTVVCFGLNDCQNGYEGIEKYKNALQDIFQSLQDNGIEIIFMTPNMMNTSVSDHIQDEDIRRVAEEIMTKQKEGILDAYMDAAKQVCEKNNVRICDCYAKWKRLYENGVDITELLANKINHPTREMNWLFATSLLDTMMQ